MDNDLKRLAQITMSVRRCFWLLAAVSDEMIKDLNVTASLRAVLEHIDQSGPSTVPQIARSKAVKRQSIQALVDQLKERNLVEAVANPNDRRSHLIELTRDGQTLFSEIRRREAGAMSRLLEGLSEIDIAATERGMSSLHDALLRMNE